MQNIYTELHDYVDAHVKNPLDERWETVERCENWLLSHLDAKARRRFIRYRDTREALDTLTYDRAFERGFHLGLRLQSNAQKEGVS